ncbi:hypothetical protein BOTBODRAFT_36056, partial [Botryobasidium botryosum FD-172 SS1]
MYARIVGRLRIFLNDLCNNTRIAQYSVGRHMSEATISIICVDKKLARRRVWVYLIARDFPVPVVSVKMSTGDPIQLSDRAPL